MNKTIYIVRFCFSDGDGYPQSSTCAFCATREIAEREKARLEDESEPAYVTDFYEITEVELITE